MYTTYMNLTKEITWHIKGVTRMSTVCPKYKFVHIPYMVERLGKNWMSLSVRDCCVILFHKNSRWWMLAGLESPDPEIRSDGALGSGLGSSGNILTHCLGANHVMAWEPTKIGCEWREGVKKPTPFTHEASKPLSGGRGCFHNSPSTWEAGSCLGSCFLSVYPQEPRS